MKKTIALILSLVFILSALAGCAAAPEKTPDKPAENTAPAETQKPEETKPEEVAPAEPDTAAKDVYSADGDVIFEDNGFKVTTAGTDIDPTDAEEPTIIWLDVENNSEKYQYLGVTGGVINGYAGTVVFCDFLMEDGEYYGSSYDFGTTIPSGTSKRVALGYYPQRVPGIDGGTLKELRFLFTCAEDEYTWYDYVSEPVTISLGEKVENPDIKTLGNVVFDNEDITIVFGEQDYDDYWGPEIPMYIENKTDSYVAVFADTAEVDGIACDYMYAGVNFSPKSCAYTTISFDGEARELLGVENLTINFEFTASDSIQTLSMAPTAALDPITATFPAQVWGNYEVDSVKFDIKPKVNSLVTVEIAEKNDRGLLFTVYETASKEATGLEGAGELFGIGKVTADKLHEMLCSDMSGADVFGKDEDGNYYIFYHPTDVRFDRAEGDDWTSGWAQWSMLQEWADNVPDLIELKNDLQHVSYTNSEVDIMLARAAWDDETTYTLTGNEYGTVETDSFDATAYIDFLLTHMFYLTDDEEMPESDFISLNFPEESVRLDFFEEPGGYVRYVTEDYELLYAAAWEDEELSTISVIESMYYAACEKAGLKEADHSLDAFEGAWYEQIAGRCELIVEKTVVPGKVYVTVRWPESYNIMNFWNMTATLLDGKLEYHNAEYQKVEIDEDGNEITTDMDWGLSGTIFLDSGELVWHNDYSDDTEDTRFIH